jgi:peptidoglycan/LPS O-acetylase OafA/YrhL
MASGNHAFLPDTAPLKMIGNWCWTGVEIFFIISGFIIPYSMYVKNYTIANFSTFLKKRIIRIEPPYLISIVLIIVLNYASTLSTQYRGAPFRIDWANLAGHVAYMNVFTGAPWLNTVFWTLAIEFQYYIIIALAYGLLASSNRYYRIAFFAVFVLSYYFLAKYDRFIFSYAFYFMLGILLFQYRCSIISKIEFLIGLVVIIALMFYHFHWEMTLLSGLAAIIILFVKKIPAPFRYLGLISYSLYLIHVPIGGRLLNLSERFTHNPLVRQGLVLVAMVVCLVVAGLYYHFIEKPFKAMSASIGYKKPSAVAGQLEL